MLPYLGGEVPGSDIFVAGTSLSALQPIGCSELEHQCCPHNQAKQNASEHHSTIILTTPDEACDGCAHRPFNIPSGGRSSLITSR